MQQLLRDPVIQNTRLMSEESQQWVGQGEGSQEGVESENPLVGVTITKSDKVQPIKVNSTSNGDVCITCFVKVLLKIHVHFSCGNPRP